jgi:hypothetical protein
MPATRKTRKKNFFPMQMKLQDATKNRKRMKLLDNFQPATAAQQQEKDRADRGEKKKTLLSF